MHRLTKTSFCFSILALAGAATACGGGKKGADNPEATYDIDAGEDGNDDAEKADGGAPERKKEACVGFDIGNLEDLLAKSDCEVPDAKPDSVDNPDMKGKLEVTLTSSPTRVAPGGKADLLVTFANKTNAPLPLRFRIDPLARFETEVYDAKKKRADVPPGNPPPPPKGHSAPPPAEQKVGMVTVAPNGSARVRVPWEAVKMKWAPNKVRGTAVEKGYPRVPSGALAKGKYTVKVVTPLIGVFEGGDHEMSSPSVEIEVGL
ncbi:MAG: hypothetical protein BGO98_48920 [Myxococcales bacterium 68-20]|nr:hypothetical protein [Myxococcales bacterium]OJY29750.1 MAG: hypothetical protein BGO98_48920 [Myxococcales bacterium 68-20]